jgi:outer membrane protein
MRKILFVISTAVLLALGSVAFATENKSATKDMSAGARIGVINLEKILIDSPQLAAAKSDLKKKFGPREKALVEEQEKFKKAIEKFSKDSPTMKADAQKVEQQKIIDQQKKIQEMQGKFQDDLNKAQNEAMNKILKKIEGFVSNIAINKGFDLVVAKGSVAYNKPELEITDEVTKQMKGGKK